MGFIKEGKLLLILYKLALALLETTSQAASNTIQGGLYLQPRGTNPAWGVEETARQQWKVLITVDTGVGVREQHMSKHSIKPMRHKV